MRLQGSIAFFGADVARASPRVRRRAGMHFVPEERLGRGAVPTLSLAQNTLLTRTASVGKLGFLHLGEDRRASPRISSRSSA